MTTLKVGLVFGDVRGGTHYVSATFTAGDLAECYKAALDLCTALEEANGWMLLHPIKVERIEPPATP